MAEQKTKSKNEFVENLLKNQHREIEVVIYHGETEVILKGTCEGLEYGGQKGIIIRNATHTMFIPRYMYIKRARTFGVKPTPTIPSTTQKTK